MWPLLADRADEAPQVAARLRIEPGRRLVEEEDARVVDERRGDAEALLLAAGKRPHLALRLLGQVDEVQQRHRVDVALVEPAEEVQQLDEGQLVEEGRRLELDADAPLHLARVGLHVDAVDDGLAAIDRAHPLDHLEGRRLARAVRSEDPEDLALGDLEADAVDRRQAAVLLAQVGDGDDRCAERRGRSAGVPTAGTGAVGGSVMARILSSRPGSAQARATDESG